MLDFQTKTGLIRVSPQGAALVCWQIKTKDGMRDLLFYPENAPDESDYINVIVGPRSGRYPNEDGVELHGGPHGYSHQRFLLTLLEDGIQADYRDERSDVLVKVSYRLKTDGLSITLEALPGHPMHLNLTSHLYFTLGQSSIRDLDLKIRAQGIVKKDGQLPVGYDTIPEEKAFHTKGPIGSRVIDDCYLLDPAAQDKACLKAKDQSLALTLQTDQSALVVYTYDYPKDPLNRRRAVALEAQAPPGITAFDPPGAEYCSPSRPYCKTIFWQITP